MNLKDIRDKVLKCERCELCKTRTNYVFGEGKEDANIIFIGEAPGAQEDMTGRPFVGRAGQVFDELLGSIKLGRGDIFIANILKCRPPNNRNPEADEIRECTPFLEQQIKVIKPKVICTMGNYSTKFIMKKYGLEKDIDGISKLHGKVFKVKNLFEEIEIIPLYHPAVATYNPDMKNVLMKDIKILEARK